MSKTALTLVIIALIAIAGIAGTSVHYYNKFTNAPPNTLSVQTNDTPVAFQWVATHVNEQTEPHGAMMIPVQLPGIEQTFFMQFDTGAPSTVFSYRQIKSINEKFGPVFNIKQEDTMAWIEDAEFTVGSMKVHASKLQFRGLGNKIDWDSPPAMINIGTIGADFMEHHVLSIDYQNQMFRLQEPEAITGIDDAAFLPFKFDGRKVFLSATLNNENVELWFDSGSSAFELIVDESTFEQFATPGASRNTFVLNSWGNGITAHNIAASGEFTFGSTHVPLTYVTHMEWPNKLQVFVMRLSAVGGNLGGMTGNKLFLNKTLVLDTPNRRYAVIEG